MQTDAMEKRFYHEHLRDPQDRLWKLNRAFVDAMRGYHGGSVPVQRLVLAMQAQGFDDHTIKNFLPTAEGVLLHDAALVCLSYIGQFFVREPAEAYVFSKEFFPVLMKTRIRELSWDMIPDNFLGVFRFPAPLIDQDGDRIKEVMVCIKPREQVERDRFKILEGVGSRVLSLYWMTSPISGPTGAGFVVQVLPDGKEKIIPETWNSKFIENGWLPSKAIGEDLIYKTADFNSEELSYVVSILKALIYVCSGNPDLRDEKNPIRYQSENSQTPVRAHKEFSQLNFKRVGWNWMKSPEYKTDAWGVEPHMRFQPYGPGRTQYRWIMVKEHERQRRKKNTDLGAEMHA
jgi:hypothetical protein